MNYTDYMSCYPKCDGEEMRDFFNELREMDNGIRNVKGDEITFAQAREFYRDLCGTVYGDCNKTCGGIMSVGLIADHMRMSIEKANRFLWACAKYGITERQGGAWVV